MSESLTRRLVPAHPRPPRRVVDIDRHHPRQACRCAARSARCRPQQVMPSSSSEASRSCSLERLDETLLELGVVEQGHLIENRRQRLARRLGQGIAAAVIVSPARCRRSTAPPPGSQGSTSPAAYRLPPLTARSTSVRNRQAAVITGSVGSRSVMQIKKAPKCLFDQGWR
jgi:hypothetical protein